MFRRAIAAGALALIAAQGASAQAAAAKSVLSIQPLNAVFEVYTAEFEHAWWKAGTIGFGGTYWAGFEDDDAQYTSGEVKLRYYPSGVALQGFSIGAALGLTRISNKDSFSGRTESASGPSFGVVIEHQWLLGPKKNFAIALGLGAKALSIDEDDFQSTSVSVRYPTARISVGIAF